MLTYGGIQDWYDMNSKTVFNLQSATYKQWDSFRVNFSNLASCKSTLFFHSILQCVNLLWEMHTCTVCWSIKLTTFRSILEVFNIPIIRLQFHILSCIKHSVKDRWLAISHHLIVLLDSLFIQLQNTQWYYFLSFHNSTFVGWLVLVWNIAYVNAEYGIMSDDHVIWVQFTLDEEIYLSNTVPEWVRFIPVLISSWTQLYQFLHFQ